ncbi:MAG TPA: nuclear transport factor 2 family protein [Candidatus Didemnitutus sp.]|nr:nuclear transport factor 2 family protein [Candidatus Didemnitutus sp.]
MSFILRGIIAAAILSGSVLRLAGAPVETTFVRDFYAAYSARDAGRLAEFYAPDASLEDPSFGLSLHGSKSIHDLLAAVLTKYQSLDWSIEHVTSSGETRVIEGTMTGTLGAKVVKVHFVSVFVFSGERIVAQRDLYDVLHFYSQLGIVPPEFRSPNKT